MVKSLLIFTVSAYFSPTKRMHTVSLGDVLETLTLHVVLFHITLKRAQMSFNVLLAQFNCSLLVDNASLCYRYLVVSEEWEYSWR